MRSGRRADRGPEPFFPLAGARPLASGFYSGRTTGAFRRRGPLPRKGRERPRPPAPPPGGVRPRRPARRDPARLRRRPHRLRRAVPRRILSGRCGRRPAGKCPPTTSNRIGPSTTDSGRITATPVGSKITGRVPREGSSRPRTDGTPRRAAPATRFGSRRRPNGIPPRPGSHSAHSIGFLCA